MRGESSDKTPPLLRFVLELGLSESMGGDGRTSSHSSSWVSRSSLLPSLGVGGGGGSTCVTSAGRLLSFFIHKLSTADWFSKETRERHAAPPFKQFTHHKEADFGCCDHSSCSVSHTHTSTAFVKRYICWNEYFFFVFEQSKNHAVSHSSSANGCYVRHCRQNN